MARYTLYGIHYTYTLTYGTAVPRSAGVCVFCPRFRGATCDSEDEMHLFICPQYKPQKGAYPRVLNSRAYRQFCSAEANHDPEVNTLFRTFLI
jgi:hypothetical protein